MIKSFAAVLVAAAALAGTAWGQAAVKLERQQMQMPDGSTLSNEEIPDDTITLGRKRPGFNLHVQPQLEKDGTTSLLALCEVAYANLNWRKADDGGWVAKFRAEMRLQSDAIGKNQLLKATWGEEIHVATYEETRGRGKTKSILSVRRILDVPPAETAFTFKTIDLDAKTTFSRKDLKLNILPPQPGVIRVSPPMLLAKHDPKTMATTPLMGETVTLGHAEKKPLDYYLRLYNPANADSAQLISRIADAQGKVLWTKTETVALKPGVNELVRSNAEALTDEFLGKSGVYKLELFVVPTVQGKPIPSGHTQTVFRVNYLGLPENFDPEEVIDELQHLRDYPEHFITDRNVADKIRADIDVARKSGLERCGLKHCVTKDPAKLAIRHKAIADLVNSLPEDLKALYFKRVEVANQYFSVGSRKGYTTDRGLVYIVLGPMDDRQSSRAVMVGDLGVEVWMYWSHPMTGRPFQVGFYDRSNGFKDFWLMDEISNVTIEGQQVGLCQIFGGLCYSSRDWAKGEY